MLLHACQICNTGSVLLMSCGISFKTGHLRRGRCRCCRYSTWSWLHAGCYDNAGQTSEHCCSNLRHGYGYQMQLALSFTTKQPTVPAAARVTTKPFCFHSHARKLRKFKRTALRLSTTTGLCRAGTMQCDCALLYRKSHLILPVCNGRKLQDRREEQLSSRNKVWMLYLY